MEKNDSMKRENFGGVLLDFELLLLFGLVDIGGVWIVFALCICACVVFL